MNTKNGYTVIELVVIIILLGIATLLITLNMTKIFKDDSEEVYEEQIMAILAKGKEFGNENLEELQNSENGITITVNRLIEDGFLTADKNGNLINPKNKKTKLNDLKILITYDESNEIIKTEIIE